MLAVYAKKFYSIESWSIICGEVKVWTHH